MILNELYLNSSVGYTCLTVKNLLVEAFKFFFFSELIPEIIKKNGFSS